MICMYPDKRLKKKCTLVADVNDTRVKYVCDVLKKEYSSRECQGIASTQLGLDLAIAIVRLGKKGVNPTVIINPRVVKSYFHRNSLEHCESSKGWYVVKRPILARIEYMIEDGTIVNKLFTYKKCRVLCHEIDHINGLCLPDTGKLSMFSNQYDKKMGYC